MKRIDIPAGTRFGLLIVLREAPKSKRGNMRFLCRCDCGAETISHSNTLRTGKVSGCRSCSGKQAHPAGTQIKHGKSYSPIYRVWDSMVRRCTNPKHKKYRHYGGRGITVCAKWMTFENFYSDMGDPPSGLTLERKNNELGYSLDNCIWATYSDQNRNRRRWANEDMAKRKKVA